MHVSTSAPAVPRVEASSSSTPSSSHAAAREAEREREREREDCGVLGALIAWVWDVSGSGITCDRVDGSLGC